MGTCVGNFNMVGVGSVCAAVGLLFLGAQTEATQGLNYNCNLEDHGIPCCEESFTPGDNNGKKEQFIQAEDYKTDCIQTCRTLHPHSTGITERVNQKYTSGKGKGKNKCWCEFGDAKLDASSTDYQTCVFTKPSPLALMVPGVAQAGASTILETAFNFLDANSNGAWEIGELTVYAPGMETIVTSLFGEIDTNGDRKITTEEFKGFCAKLLTGIFKLNDPNLDGVITSAELLSGDAATDSKSGLIGILFRILDVNKDGFLSTQDVIPQNMAQIVVSLDTNRDGVIGLQEYNQYHAMLEMPRAPPELVKLYNKIDKNSDDKFTLAEIEGFLTACLAIMDANSDGTITLDEQANAFQQAGLTKAQAEVAIKRSKMGRSSDMVNKIITTLDTNNDEKISQAEVTDILDLHFNSPKTRQLALLGQEIGEPNDFQMQPQIGMSPDQALRALGRFLDNPKFN